MTKKKSYIPVHKLKKAIRRLYYQTDEYKACKERNKVESTVYRCELCDAKRYDGKSEKNFEKLKLKYPDITRDKFDVDHLNPISDTKLGWQGWDVHLSQLFCSRDELQYICKPCHKVKSALEQAERKDNGTLKRKK